MHNINANITSLVSWKKEKKQKTDLQTYYQLLSFQQLIGESRQLRKKLISEKLTSELSLHTKLIFDEIQNRMISSDQKDIINNYYQKIDNIKL